MGGKKIEAYEYTCDGCGSIQLIVEDYEYQGYRGSVQWDHATGGNSGDWAACSKKCITKAITSVLEARD